MVCTQSKLNQALGTDAQSLEMALLILNQEVNKLEGMKKVTLATCKITCGSYSHPDTSVSVTNTPFLSFAGSFFDVTSPRGRSSIRNSLDGLSAYLL